MNIETEIKLLCISSNDWCIKNIKSLLNNNFIYNILLLLSDILHIKYRLLHNSYDILIIDYNYLKKLKIHDLFLFNKLSFAMSRPSLILCNNKLQCLYLKFLLFHTIWIKKFKSAKSFVNISTILNTLFNSNIINSALVYHSYIKEVSKEIYTVFINE